MTANGILTTILGLILSVSVFAQETENKETVTYEPRVYTTASIAGTEGITIDGVLDEAACDVVEWTSDYLEFQPDVGTPPSEQTKMKIVYDDKNLYVAFICYEADPSTIEKRMGRRDDFPGDWVEINIDSYNDDRTGFSFTISASGVKGDEFISDNGDFDSSWKDKLQHILQVADLVKLATAKPPADFHDRVWQEAEDFVIATKVKPIIIAFARPNFLI